jgi:predicted amidohydrolase YtcJ
VNSKALEAAGITADTPDPANGEITRRSGTREPEGLLKESAQGLVRRVMPEATRADKRRALAAGIARAHALGVTSIQNASGSEEELAVYEEARAAGELPLRVYSSLSVSPGFAEAEADRFDAVRRRITSDDRFKVGAVKLLVDGVIETNTAVMLAPYVNNPATSGVPNHQAPELDRIVRLLDARGWQIFIHAIGDGGVRMTLDAFERAARANPEPPRGRRHRVEHIETIDPADVPRFGALGVIASMQPPHTRLMNGPSPKGQWTANIGFERQARGWMWKGIQQSGGRLAFGSDWPVASLDPLAGIWIGLNRIGHGDVPNQRLTLAEMIDGYTIGPAYGSFDEARKGRLAAGHLADVVILTRDVFEQPPASADDVKVATTIFGGKIVYRR